MLKTIKEYTSEMFKHPELESIPMTRLLPTSKAYITKYTAISNRLHRFIRNKINERKASFMPLSEKPEDFVQASKYQMLNRFS